MTQMSRRHVLGLGVGGALGVSLGAPLLRGARASEAGTEAHGISAFGDLKYPADFHHFGYVNVDAPKGGSFSLIPSSKGYNQSFQTFNSLNAFILKGEGAQGMDLTFATADGACRRRARRDVRLCRQIGADIRGQKKKKKACLSLHAYGPRRGFMTARN